MLYEVRRNNKSGYIDSKGNIIVAIEADRCLELRGLGGVFRGQQLEIVNDKGTVVGSCSGVWARGPYSEGRLVTVDKANLAENPELAAGYLDQTGRWIIPPKFRQASDFHEGVAVASVSYGGTRRCEGLIDLSGNWIDEPKFETILGFGPGMTVTIARQYHGRKRDVRCLLIDKMGQQVGQEFFENGRAGSEGLIAVMRGGKFGCVDESAQLAIPFSFEDMSYFSEGLAAARVGNEKVGAIDKNGHWAIHPVFVYVEHFCGGLAAAQIKEMGIYKWGYIDRNGDWVIKPQFEEAYDFVDGVAEVIPLGVNPDKVEQMGYIDTKGEYIWELSMANEL